MLQIRTQVSGKSSAQLSVTHENVVGVRRKEPPFPPAAGIPAGDFTCFTPITVARSLCFLQHFFPHKWFSCSYCFSVMHSENTCWGLPMHQAYTSWTKTNSRGTLLNKIHLWDPRWRKWEKWEINFIKQKVTRQRRLRTLFIHGGDSCLILPSFTPLICCLWVGKGMD